MSEALNHSKIVSESSTGTQKTRKGLNFQMTANVKKSMHGTKMPRTKIQVLQEVPIALPPLDEQKEILKKIKQSNETTSNIKNSIQKIHEKAEKLIQYQNHIQISILDAAFSGKLVK